MKLSSERSYQIAVMQPDLFIQSQDSDECRQRPWLMLCFDPHFQLVISWIISDSPPDDRTLKALLFTAFLSSPEKPYRGLPAVIWVDERMMEFISGIEQALRSLDIKIGALSMGASPLPEGVERFFALLNTPPQSPKFSGTVERLFASLNTTLYTGAASAGISDDIENPSQSISPQMTLEQAERFVMITVNRYHHTVNTTTGRTPLESWNVHPFQHTTIDLDIHKLALLFGEHLQRWVSKSGIRYDSKNYWHTNLTDYLGRTVDIYISPLAHSSASIQISDASLPILDVYASGQWICSATRVHC